MKSIQPPYEPHKTVHAKPVWSGTSAAVGIRGDVPQPEKNLKRHKATAAFKPASAGDFFARWLF